MSSNEGQQATLRRIGYTLGGNVIGWSATLAGRGYTLNEMAEHLPVTPLQFEMIKQQMLVKIVDKAVDDLFSEGEEIPAYLRQIADLLDVDIPEEES